MQEDSATILSTPNAAENLITYDQHPTVSTAPVLETINDHSHAATSNNNPFITISSYYPQKMPQGATVTDMPAQQQQLPEDKKPAATSNDKASMRFVLDEKDVAKLSPHVPVHLFVDKLEINSLALSDNLIKLLNQTIHSKVDGKHEYHQHDSVEEKDPRERLKKLERAESAKILKREKQHRDFKEKHGESVGHIKEEKEAKRKQAWDNLKSKPEQPKEPPKAKTEQMPLPPVRTRSNETIAKPFVEDEESRVHPNIRKHEKSRVETTLNVLGRYRHIWTTPRYQVLIILVLVVVFLILRRFFFAPAVLKRNLHE